jgi:hypothetical protein
MRQSLQPSWKEQEAEKSLSVNERREKCAQHPRRTTTQQVKLEHGLLR